MKTAAIRSEEYLRSAIRSATRIRATDVNKIRGWAYCRAAEDDERNGFPFTAALEWYRAAHCFDSQSAVSDRCWRAWERIMRIPRALANSVIDTEGQHEQLFDQRRANSSLPAYSTPGRLFLRGRRS